LNLWESLSNAEGLSGPMHLALSLFNDNNFR
jgi:hypothetical protein